MGHGAFSGEHLQPDSVGVGGLGGVEPPGGGVVAAAADLAVHQPKVEVMALAELVDDDGHAEDLPEGNPEVAQEGQASRAPAGEV